MSQFGVWLVLVPWAISSVFVFSKIWSARRVSLSCHTSHPSSLAPHSLPFVRNDFSEFPSPLVILVRSCTLGALAFICTLFVVASIGCVAICCPRSVLRRVLRVALPFDCWLMGISRVVQRGTRAEPHEAPCIVANHQCMMDGPLLLSLGGRIVVKSSMRHFPVIGRILEELDAIFVDRDTVADRESAKRSIHELLLKTQKIGKKSTERQLVVFPEGTVTNGQNLLLFRRGVFEANVPVQPLKIEYSDPLVNMNARRLFEAWCIGNALRSRSVVFHWLPVVRPGTDGESPEEFAERVRKEIATAPSAFARPPLVLADAAISHRDGLLFDHTIRCAQKCSKQE